jgi:type I restriction enzyme, S subunit
MSLSHGMKPNFVPGAGDTMQEVVNAVNTHSAHRSSRKSSLRSWPTVELRWVLRLDLDRIAVDASKTYPMVGVLSFGRGLFDREPIENGKTSYRFFYRLKPEHVVMSQLFAWEGALALSEKKFAGKFLSPQFPTFVCDSNKLDRQFLGWLMKRPAFWEDLGSRASGMGDRRRTLTPEALFKCAIPLPPLSEQRRIVARIEELAAQIHEARTLRQQAVEETEALVTAETSRMFEVLLQAERQPIKTLGSAGENPIQIGPFGAQLHKTDFLEAGTPVLNVGNVWPEGLRLQYLDHVSDEKARQLRRYSINTGDLLFARSGATLGKVCLVPDQCDGWLMTGHLLRVRFDPDRVFNRFAFAAFRSSRQLQEEIFGQIRGATRPGYNTTLLGNVKLPVPALPEQRRIVAELDALQAQVDALQRLQSETAAELDALLPAVLDRAFKGDTGSG